MKLRCFPTFRPLRLLVVVASVLVGAPAVGRAGEIPPDAGACARVGNGGGTAGVARATVGAAYDVPTGTLLFAESFEDTKLSARGWYDGPAARLADDASPGAGTHSFECEYKSGASGCAGGKPARHKFAATDAVYVSMQIKFSSNWIGSGKPYHPHMFHITTDKDNDYVGPASSHLSLYIEVVNGKPVLALTDTLSVDAACILRNNDAFIGCNGSFKQYVFSEQRSVAACNGLVGDVDGHDCFANGREWTSVRTWSPASPWFADAPGARFKGDWHHLEAYFQMNSIVQGAAVADGRLRLWLDGTRTLTYDHILFRTGANATQHFTQFLILPFIGGGSPIEQSFFVDDLRVGTGVLASRPSDPSCLLSAPLAPTR